MNGPLRPGRRHLRWVSGLAALAAATACSDPGSRATAESEAPAVSARADGRAGDSEARATPISQEELLAVLETGSTPLLLDVRSPEEYAEAHIPGAVNIPYDELPTRLAELEEHREGEIVVYCRTGRRAQIAAATLKDAGFENLRDLDGHISAWQAKDLPLASAAGCC